MTSRERLRGAIVIGAMIAALVLGLTWLAGCFKNQPETEGPASLAEAPADAGRASGLMGIEQFTIDTTGTPGAASATATLGANGEIYAVYLDYAGSISNTTDLSITAGDPAMTILSKTDYYTDTWFYPVFQEASTAGAAVTSYRPVYIYGSVTAVLTQTTAATPCLTVTILFQP